MPGCIKSYRPQSRTANKMSVRFCETIVVFPVITRSEYTEREMIKCFFSPEYAQNMSLWLSAVGQVMHVDETRGLEAWLPDGGEEDESLRELHADSVMNEQDRQFDQGIDDQWAIAEACKRTSKKGAIMAYIRGKKDERAAFGAYMKLENDYSLMCVAPSPTSMDRATVRSYFAAFDIDRLSSNLVLVTPAA